MKRIALFTALLLGLYPLSAQVVKIDAGATFSSMQDDTEMHQFTHNNTGATVRIGVDWLEHEWFYLSSEVGYMATGGTDKIYIANGGGVQTNTVDWTMRRDNIHINTTFRAKLAYGSFHAYVGVGPKLDIPLNITMNDNLESDYTTTFATREIMFGIKTEVGAAYDINNLRLGINFAFLPDITRQKSYLNQTTRNNIFSLGVSVGYIL